MSLFSREILVGFLLVFSLVVIGCQPVQPIPATPSIESDGGTEAISETGPLTTSVTTVPVTNSETISTPITLPATETVTASITATPVITVAAETEVNAEVEADVRVQAAAPVDHAVLAVGMAVYRAQYCGVCHTLDAAETRGTFGPTHNGMGSIAAERILEPTYGGAANNAAEYIRESIVNPQLYIVPGYAATSHRMPSYAHVEGESLDALVAFLLAQ